MAKRGALKSVAHNIADHAKSGLSFIHPHAAQVSRRCGLSPLILDLKLKDPLPVGIESYQPLELSSQAIQKKFVEILNKENIDLDSLMSARLELLFLNDDEYYCVSTCILTDNKGKEYRATAS